MSSTVNLSIPKGRDLLISIAVLILEVSLVIGVILLSINVVGLFLSLRDPQVAAGREYFGQYQAAELSAPTVYAAFDRREGEDNASYARRVTESVSGGIIHYWEEDGNRNLRVPIWENWLLWLNGGEPYEFCDPYKAVERGTSVCSQASKILVSVLQNDGGFVDVYPVVLEGHVVAQVLIDLDQDTGTETWWTLDADYGVIIEHSTLYLSENREAVIEAYMAAGYSQEIAERVAEIYGEEGNYIERNGSYCRHEAQSYRDIWRYPLLMLTPWGIVMAAGLVAPRFFDDWTAKRRGVFTSF